MLGHWESRAAADGFAASTLDLSPPPTTATAARSSSSAGIILKHADIQTSSRRQMQAMRAARLHAEQHELSMKERPIMQAMRAARLHQEEKALYIMDAAAAIAIAERSGAQIQQPAGPAINPSSSSSSSSSSSLSSTSTTTSAVTTSLSATSKGKIPFGSNKAALMEEPVTRRKVARRSSELFRAVSFRAESVAAARRDPFMGNSAVRSPQRRGSMQRSSAPPSLHLWSQSSDMVISEEEGDERVGSADSTTTAAEEAIELPRPSRFRSHSAGSKVKRRGSADGIASASARTSPDFKSSLGTQMVTATTANTSG